jgi:poly(3-hydroxybutyrate) depolymerase
MDAAGLAYVPAACAAGGGCRLHVALHGCAQGREAVGDVFATRAGYNGWAEANRIVVLYPQASATLTNPQGCWDWYGYDDESYHLKAGRQMAALKGMMDRVAGSR